jgi:hypothetical protein
LSAPIAGASLAVSEAEANWHTEVDGLGERIYIHRLTNVRRSTPPTASAAQLAGNVLARAPFKKKTKMVVEAQAITKNEYVNEFKENRRVVDSMVKEMRAMNLIARIFRKMVVYKRQKRDGEQLKYKRRVYNFMVKNVRFVNLVHEKRIRRIIRVQAIWRGFHLRHKFLSSGEYRVRWIHAKKIRLALALLRLWKRFKLVRLMRQLHTIEPTSFEEWQMYVKASKLLRVVASIEEYRFANQFFYRNSISGICFFKKPPELIRHDLKLREVANKPKIYGYSFPQIRLIIKLQALFRGKLARSYPKKVEKAETIADTSLELYLKHPDVDTHVYNYALYTHVILNDNSRSRAIYSDCLRRMERGGPDIPLVLYAYSIFVFVYHEADYSEVRAMLTRAKTAEFNIEMTNRHKRGLRVPSSEMLESFRYGSSFDNANIGYFKRYAEIHNTNESWHHYAACQFLVYNDFDNAFYAFVRAFEYDPLDKRLRSNFDLMMQSYYGDDQEQKEMVMKSYVSNQSRHRIAKNTKYKSTEIEDDKRKYTAYKN